MKTKIPLILAACIAAFAMLSSGCKTTAGASPAPVAVTTNGVLMVFGNAGTTNEIATTMKLAGTAGATAAINYDPNSRAYLQTVVSILNATLDSGQYDPALLQSALQNISVNEAHDPNVTAGLNLALSTYATFFSATVDQQIADASIYLIPALTGLRDGIQQVVGVVLIKPIGPEPEP